MSLPVLYIDSGEEEEPEVSGGMEVEKSAFEWVMDWVNYHRGVAPNPLIEPTPPTPTIVTVRNADLERAREQVRRKRLEEAQEREAMRQVRLRKPVPYIGDDTQTERFFTFHNLLLRPTKNTINGMQVLDKKPWIQNPYDDSTWRNRDQLALLLDPTKVELSPSGASSDIFKSLYREVSRGVKVSSYSSPEIFLLRANDRERFKSILYGDDTLLMKITPFINAEGHLVDDNMIEQMYNEIKIAYFLNELLYNYTHVLSIHFVVLVDWFQTSRENLGLYRDATRPSPMDRLYGQVTIAEYADTDLYDYLSDNATLATLKAVVFQVLHSLETAWLTNEFIHLDLHSGNIRMKRTDYDASPFQGRNLLYNRNGLDHWYSLSYRDLGEHIVKILDFGFSRAYVPSQPQHKTFDRFGLPSKHVHSKLIGLNWPAAGIIAQRPNRFADVRMFLISMLTLPMAIWAHIPMRDRVEFYSYTEDILDFAEINRLIDRTTLAKEERRVKAGGILTAANLVDCPQCTDQLRMIGGYARVYTETGRTATEALDHPFFHSLTRLGTADSIKGVEDVVVSFFTQTGEEEMLTSLNASLDGDVASRAIRCAVCHATAEHYNMENNVPIPLCGGVCAEFRYVHHSKTVFR